MFNKIFIEKNLQNHQKTESILKLFPKSEQVLIDRWDAVFGRVYKPYLQKRDNLNLFIAEKKGQIVKEAPDAYGVKGEKHYYFMNTYNCIYECEYCYLQGYFKSPDIVMFINYDDILKAIEEKIKDEPVWFHAGEFSDSLALHHITGECEEYYKLFKKHPQAFLELRTKSANIKALKELSPLKNVITSFSLSTEKQIKKYDKKTASLNARLQAISELHKRGHPIGVHFDPLVYTETIFEDFESLLNQLEQVIPLNEVSYYSLGVVRFTKSVYAQAKKNYPDSSLWQEEFIKSFDGKVRYMKPFRKQLLNTLQTKIQKRQVPSESIYLCME